MRLRSTLIVCMVCLAASIAWADPSVSIDTTKIAAHVSPMLYGLMTEEINYSYDGGLYAELIRNRTFKDDPQKPVHWTVTPDNGGSIALDEGQPVEGTALTTCLKLTATAPSAGVANDGYWGIPVRPKTTYRASFYAKSDAAAGGPLAVSIVSNDGGQALATAQVPHITNQWQKYSATLTTGDDAKTSAENHFVISTQTSGTYWFNLVSLFPPTYNDRPNGDRIDLMQLLVDMHPSFLRLPGGNYLEGNTFDTRYPWKKTLGGLEQRPGHMGCWSYRSSDGMGLLEYMEWCEDMHAEPLLAVFAGYSLKHQVVPAGPGLQPFVDDALDEIEYVTGGPDTKWGAERIKDGHPEPFKLTYIEIGNEDGFDTTKSYDGRFTQFYDAIKGKYPDLKLISTVGGQDGLGRRQPVFSRKPDAVDEHYYETALQMEDDSFRYDGYKRPGPKVFVGEWATREGSSTTNMNAALADSAWMAGLERNSDLVILASYAPLFVNVNPKAMQWRGDLIGYNDLVSYGSPSYYAQKMFKTYLGDVVLPIAPADIPTQTWQRPAPKPRGGAAAGAPPPPKQVPTLFFAATKSTEKGEIYLKVVNTHAEAQTVKIDLAGAADVASEGTLVTLSSTNPTDTNSVDAPTKIIPVTTKATGLGQKFDYTFAPYSVNVLVITLK